MSTQISKILCRAKSLGAVVPTDQVPIAAVRAAARQQLVEDSESARQRFMTSGDLKSAVYRQKQEEASAWQVVVAASGTPNPTDYPFLRARALRLDPENPDYQAVADEWNARAAVWLVIGPQIEDLYEAAIEAVDAAASVGAIEAALQVSWPQPD